MSGAFAAIRAIDLGADVLLVDKAFFGRGGCASLASGAYGVFMPGDKIENWLVGMGDLVDQSLLSKSIPLTYDLAQLMEKWGVGFVKEGGKWRRFSSASMATSYTAPRNLGLIGGGPGMMMALRGEALRRGVRVINRVMITDLLTSDGMLPTSGEVIGAIGINTRSADVLVFSAKAVIICAGGFSVPYPHPGEPLTGMPIDLSGDGVGADLVGPPRGCDFPPGLPQA